MIVGSGNRQHSFISAADAVGFVVAAVDNPKAINQRLLLGGPEPLSFRDAVATYQRVMGCPLEIRAVNPARSPGFRRA